MRTKCHYIFNRNHNIYITIKLFKLQRFILFKHIIDIKKGAKSMNKYISIIIAGILMLGGLGGINAADRYWYSR